VRLRWFSNRHTSENALAAQALKFAATGKEINHDTQGLLALGLAAAISFMPLAAVAHEGQDHGANAKKVKKSKLKNGAAEFILRRDTA
jgi:hypothetical protein